MAKSIYLLTGASGNLGNSISDVLRQRGKVIRALVRNPGKSRLDKDIEIIHGDLLNIPSLEKFFSTDEYTDVYVIHCASEVTLIPGYSKQVHDSNITGTQNIIEQCRKHNVRKLVYVSSTGAIPELPGKTPIVEVNRFDPEAVVGYYNKSKAAATQLVFDSVNLQDIDASVVFPSGIIGPPDYKFGLVTKAMIYFIKGRLPFAVEGEFNCTDVRDLAEGIVNCCEKGKKGEGYIMGNGIISMRELFDMIADVSGCRRVRAIVPIWIAKVFAVFSEVYGKITGRSVLITRITIYNLLRNNNFNSEKAVRELDYHVRPFSETIKDEVAWLREEGRI